MFESILRNPDVVVVEGKDYQYKNVEFTGDYKVNDIQLIVKTANRKLYIQLCAKETPVFMIRLRWHLKDRLRGQVLGDSWERSYGDMGWNHLISYQPMPWYFLINREEYTAGYGVMVRPKALCFWQADPCGITLWLDVRNGGEGVILNGRILDVATIVCNNYENISAFHAAQKFCRMMCEDPILPPQPVYGANNWYYAYGHSSREDILVDTEYLVRLTRGAENKPFMVIDDCWQRDRYDEDGNYDEGYNGGPWLSNEKFGDMKKLASDISENGARPGIWVRFLHDHDSKIPEEWRLSHNSALDPSHPDVLAHIQEDVKRISGWGYELLKHDFTTFDIFGKWGCEMKPLATEECWHFYNRNKTSAEIIIDLYKAILDAAEPNHTLIMGCNTMGHLGAGLMHLNRTGDDTSGIMWERTLRFGVNTLAFRAAQNRIFYDIDADCMGITERIPWEYNRQWGELLSKSGTSMFVSLKPRSLNEEQEKQLRVLMVDNSFNHNTAEPLDWTETYFPQEWILDGKKTDFHWYEPEGLSVAWGTGSIWEKVWEKVWNDYSN